MFNRKNNAILVIYNFPAFVLTFLQVGSSLVGVGRLLGTTHGTLEGRDRRSRVGVGVMLLESHGDVELEVELSLGVIFSGLEVDNEVVLDGKDGVITKVRVVVGVELVDDSGVLGVGDHQVNVGRAPGRAVHESEENTSGAVGGKRVGSRVVAVPVELAILVGLELATEVVLGLVRVLEVVLAVGRSLPDVENSALNGLAGVHVLDNTVHECNSATLVGILNDAVTELTERSVGRPEGTENDVGSGRHALLGDNAVGDLVDEAVLLISCVCRSKRQVDSRFETNDIADTVTLVTDGSTDLTNRVDELNTHHPLSRSKLDLTGKVVDVLDQGSENDTSTVGSARSHGIDDIGSEVGVKSCVSRHFGGCVCKVARSASTERRLSEDMRSTKVLDRQLSEGCEKRNGG